MTKAFLCRETKHISQNQSSVFFGFNLQILVCIVVLCLFLFFVEFYICLIWIDTIAYKNIYTINDVLVFAYVAEINL